MRSQENDLSVLSQDSCSEVEQRPLSPPTAERRQSEHKYKKPPIQHVNRDLPLQSRAVNRSGNVSEGTAEKQTGVAGEPSKDQIIATLEQRNRHLELELKRAQQQFKHADSMYVKYKDLKIDYKQLLQSFERSEEIRREQKDLISDQKKQIKSYKHKLKRQDSKMQEMVQVDKKGLILSGRGLLTDGQGNTHLIRTHSKAESLPSRSLSVSSEDAKSTKSKHREKKGNKSRSGSRLGKQGLNQTASTFAT